MATIILDGHTDVVINAVFDPTGELVATCSSRDDTARIWDAAQGRLLQTIHLGIRQVGMESAISNAEFSPDGHFVMLADSDGLVRQWDTSFDPIDHNALGDLVRCLPMRWERKLQQIVPNTSCQVGVSPSR
jgi:WD40 repeat protein